MLAFGGTVYNLIIFLGFGVLAGFLFCFIKSVSAVVKNNVIVVFVCDFFAPLFACIIHLGAIFRFESGAVSFFSVVPFLIGMLFIWIFLQKMFVNTIKLVYNKFKFRKKHKGERLNDKN